MQFGFSCRQQIVSCSVGSVPMIQSDAETVRFDCSKMFKVMSQCTFRSASSNPVDPQDFCNIATVRLKSRSKDVHCGAFPGCPSRFHVRRPRGVRHAVVAVVCGHAAIPLRGIAMDQNLHDAQMNLLTS